MLKGKAAIVTGATGGIGLGIAEALAKSGADLLLSGLGEASAIAALVERLGERHEVRVRHHPADLEKPKEIRALIDEAENVTRANTGLNLVVAFNYGGRQEIVAAAAAVAADMAAGRLPTGVVDEAAIASRLGTAGIPDPDLVIRTSGEQRLSNFLLWQAAYAEFVFLDVLWPDFDASHLGQAIAEFRRRERRYGARV